MPPPSGGAYISCRVERRVRDQTPLKLATVETTDRAGDAALPLWHVRQFFLTPATLNCPLDKVDVVASIPAGCSHYDRRTCF